MLTPSFKEFKHTPLTRRTSRKMQRMAMQERSRGIHHRVTVTGSVGLLPTKYKGCLLGWAQLCCIRQLGLWVCGDLSTKSSRNFVDSTLLFRIRVSSSGLASCFPQSGLNCFVLLHILMAHPHDFGSSPRNTGFGVTISSGSKTMSLYCENQYFMCFP